MGGGGGSLILSVSTGAPYVAKGTRSSLNLGEMGFESTLIFVESSTGLWCCGERVISGCGELCEEWLWL